MQNYLSTNIPTLNGMISTLVEDFPMSHPGSTVLSYDTYSLYAPLVIACLPLVLAGCTALPLSTCCVSLVKASRHKDCS